MLYNIFAIIDHENVKVVNRIWMKTWIIEFYLVGYKIDFEVRLHL